MRQGLDDDRGRMRYHLLQLIQLVFALSLILGAFIGGVTVGWWRWGRGRLVASSDEEASPSGSGALFCPEDRHDEIVLADIELDVTDAGVDGALGRCDEQVFAPGPLSRPVPPRFPGLSRPAAALGAPPGRRVPDSKAIDA